MNQAVADRFRLLRLALLLVLAAFVLVPCGAQAADDDGGEDEGDGDDDGDDDSADDDSAGDDDGEWKPVKEKRPAPEGWKPVREGRKGDQWQEIGNADALNPYSDYPNVVSFRLGFHYLPEFTLEDGDASSGGAVPDSEAFRYALFDQFSPGLLAAAAFEVGYGYRVHKYFAVSSSLGFFTQRSEKKIDVDGFDAKAAYSYMSTYLAVTPEVRIPVSMFDIFFGVGGQVVWSRFEARLRGSTNRSTGDPDNPQDGDGYKLGSRQSTIAAGAVGSFGFEYRIRDNWGLALVYRYAWVPDDFKGSTFDHGGHYGFLSNAFHF